jgi:hypothetical protein
MGDRALKDNVWVDGKVYRRGTMPPPEVAEKIGDHLWSDVAEAESNISPSGQVLRGLKDNVWIFGKLYKKGSVPTDPAVIARIDDRLWADGPPGVAAEAESGRQEAAPAPSSLSTDDKPDEDDGTGTDGDAPEPPPQSGPRGSGQAWRDYATAVGVDVPADAKRDDVIDLVRMAGKPV